jgi:hypothetical protein
MFEWRVTVSCPVQPVKGAQVLPRSAGCQRRLYVWTPQMSAADAYDEGLRVLTGWPPGTTVVAISPVGVYRRLDR